MHTKGLQLARNARTAADVEFEFDREGFGVRLTLECARSDLVPAASLVRECPLCRISPGQEISTSTILA